MPAIVSREAPTSPRDPNARAQQTADLFRRLATVEGRDADRLREAVVVLNLPVATSVAMRYRGRGEPTEDLIQVARVGLVKAVAGFDCTLGHDFLSYAVPTIRGEVRRHFRDHGWHIRPTRRLQELGVSVEEAREVLTQRLGHTPTVRELAAELDADEEDIIECVAASTTCYRLPSVDTPLTDDGLTLGDVLGEPDPAIAHVENWVSVAPLLARLPAREQRILALRFFRGWTQSQIAADIGVTQMQVSRLLSRALETLRTGLNDAA